MLLIPPAEPTPGPAPTEEVQGPTPTPSDFIIHTVAPGETLLSIAQKYSVTVALIRAANPGLPPGLDVLRVNQTLIIPMGTPMPTPTPTVNPYATPTPIPPYPPPPLLSPSNGAVFGGPDAVIVLQWASVGILHTGEWYEVRLIRPEAPMEVARTRTTAYRVPAEFYPPPEQTDREFRWEVRVVREQIGTGEYKWVSEPGPSRTFLWLAEAPTPTPSPTSPVTPTP
ncbi:MAG TPA: LysM peptidoglycan-binding domain-containing protein [Thermoflexia bacterium]|nr:LysM peptidoglycan-binding domain-containing protein [Thermoflexia bacterium]